MVKVFKNEKGRERAIESYNRLLASWDVEITEMDIQTKCGATHCITAGNKENPPLLMFHGVGDNSAVMWLLNMKELSQHFYCIAIDTIGGPGKSVPNEKFNKNEFDQIEWINEIAKAFMLDRFYVMGVSNGAAITYKYTIHERDRVIKAVCVEGGLITKPLKSMIGTLLLLFPEIMIPTKKNMIKAMSKLVSPDSNIYAKHPEVIDHIIMVEKVHNKSAMFPHKLEKYDKEMALKVKDKLYFILGDYMVESSKSRQEYVELLKDVGFKYDVIKNAGHAVNHEQPEIVNEKIIAFLN